MFTSLTRLSIFACVVLACWFSSIQVASAQVTTTVLYDFYDSKDNASQSYAQIYLDQAQCGALCHAQKAAFISTITSLGLTIIADSVTKDAGSIVYAHFDAELNLWEYEVDWTLRGQLVVSGTQGQINALNMLLGLGLMD